MKIIKYICLIISIILFAACKKQCVVGLPKEKLNIGIVGSGIGMKLTF